MHNVNLSVLFLNATMPLWLGIVLPVAALLVGLVFFFAYKSSTEKKVGSAEKQVRDIKSAAYAEAERIKAQGKE